VSANANTCFFPPSYRPILVAASERMTTRKLRTKTKGELEAEVKAGRKKGNINGGKGLANHAQLLADCLDEGDITKDLKTIYRDWQRHASKINNRRTGIFSRSKQFLWLFKLTPMVPFGRRQILRRCSVLPSRSSGGAVQWQPEGRLMVIVIAIGGARRSGGPEGGHFGHYEPPWSMGGPRRVGGGPGGTTGPLGLVRRASAARRP
jgi:hypothetical protein